MTAVARLVTFVDVRDDGADPDSMSVAARHAAVLEDGRHVLLLEGRGWTSSLMHMRLEDNSGDTPLRDGASGIWAFTSVEEIEEAARSVVGPDEPFAGHTREELEADHWAYLSDVLRQQGVLAHARDLKRLPHDVKLGEGLLARLDSWRLRGGCG